MTLRELVAQAIYESYQLIKPAPVAWEDLTEPLKPLYCEAASAAISCVLAALKEPSEAMADAAQLVDYSDDGIEDDTFKTMFKAAIAQFTRDLGTPGER